MTTTDTLMASILPEILAEFRAAHSGIQHRGRYLNLMFNLSKRDADVAIRPAKDPPETLIGRRIAKIAFAIYVSPRLSCEAPQDRSSCRSPVGRTGRQSRRHVGRAVDALATARERNHASRLFASRSVRQAAQAGFGLAALPCYLGDTSPDLVCVHHPIAAMQTSLWILTHEDLRHTARIRAFTEFAANAFSRRRPLLEGAQARPRARHY